MERDETTGGRPILRRGARKQAAYALLAAASVLGMSSLTMGGAARPTAHGGSLVAMAGGGGATLRPDNPLYPLQWGLQDIGAPRVWPRTEGRGVVVAIVDTGVDFTHPDLIGRLVMGYNLIQPGRPPADDDGHGTHLAGIVAADLDSGVGTVGVAPQAEVMPIKVLDSSGRGNVATVDAGIRWAADHGARVINLSFGDLVPGVVAPQLAAAMSYAWSRGAICVIAAGNVPGTGSQISAPGVVVVGALGRGGAPTPYSSTVGTARWGLSAPGGMDDGKQADDILSTFWTASAGSSYAYLAGSSMATAFVSGALANLISLGLTPAAAADRLVATARPMGNAARFGAGEVDLPAAVTGLPGGAGAPSAPIAAAAAPLGGPATPAAALNATPPRRSGRMPAPGIVVPASPFASPARSQALVKGHPLDVSPPFVGFATMLVAGGTVLKIRARTLRRQAEATVG